MLVLNLKEKGKKMKVKAAICYGKGEKLNIEEVNLREPGFGEVQIKVVASGICGTDLLIHSIGLPGVPSSFPIILGHEGAGIIEKLGSGVNNFEVGDHVVVAFYYCHECDECLKGKPFNCGEFTRTTINGIMPDGTTVHSKDGEKIYNFFTQSSFATHSVVSTKGLVKVDKSYDLKLLGPFGCGIVTGAGAVMNVFHSGIGDSIVIFGVGTVGISAMMAAKASGVTDIIAVDVKQSRLDFAMEMGATAVINSMDVKDVPGEIRKILGGPGANYVFNTVQLNPTVAKLGIDALAPDGYYLAVGPSGKMEFEQDLPIMRTRLKNFIMGEAIPQIDIPKLLKLNKAGMFPFEKMVQYYNFEDINQAMADLKSGAAIKPIIIMPE